VLRKIEGDIFGDHRVVDEELKAARILAPVQPTAIICIGLNYRKHAEESGAAIPTHPVVFSKFNNTLAAYGESVSLPAVAKEYDYEVELCAVIGKHATGVSKDNALDYVYGYTTANDLSVRDLQTRTSQWLLGKTMDKFFPIGPYLVTADEAGDPQAMTLTTKVNGELRQNSNTADMIFRVDEIVAYISTYFPLEPGDLITTGTPEGVAMGMANKPWLQPGDVVEVEVGSLGALRNTMRA
jgi:2-keto-4-pentenoate hydratase/2-oxohepta-3-ene-1,7-dioic acid hydratase in catechol pathway